jgi:hypothetical protein
LTRGNIDPCTLMTIEEVAMVSGYNTGPGVTKVVGPERECLFGYVGEDTWVSVALWQGVDPAAARAYYNASKALIPPSFTIAELPTFHGGAVIAHSPDPEDTGIYVIDGSNVFNVVCVLMRRNICAGHRSHRARGKPGAGSIRIGGHGRCLRSSGAGHVYIHRVRL